MKISAGRVEAFIAEPPSKVQVILLYGPDHGLVRERAEKLKQAVIEDENYAFRLAEISADNLKDDPGKLFDEAATISFTGERRVVQIREAGDFIASIFAEFFDTPVGDTLIIVESSNLGTRSTLRKIFENAEIGAAIPCYTDEYRTLKTIIEETFLAENIAVTSDALTYLINNLGGDRMTSRSELEKLMLYSLDTRKVCLEAAVACIGDNTNMALEDIAFALSLGDLARVGRLMDRALQEGISPISIIRATFRHFQRLHLAASLMIEGQPVQAALKALHPPVFFKQLDEFRAQLQIWPVERISKALTSLSKAEIRCKTIGPASKVICSQELLRISATAKTLKTKLKFVEN